MTDTAPDVVSPQDLVSATLDSAHDALPDAAPIVEVGPPDVPTLPPDVGLPQDLVSGIMDSAHDTLPDSAPIVEAGPPDVPPPDVAPPKDLAPPDGPAPKAQGASCLLGTECLSGFCTDGFCCSSACDGQCQYCAGATKGVCATVTGTPAKSGVSCPGGTHASCGASCNGTNKDCTFKGSATQCATAVCLDSSTLTKASTCNGSGDCAAPVPAEASCGDYACSAAVCKTSCTLDSDCAPAKWCNTDLGTCGGLHYTSVSTKDSHTCAVVVDKTVRCWGTNGSGQLGDGTTSAFRNHPVAVAGVTNASAVAAGGGLLAGSETGGGHTCAIQTQGTTSGVLCWGDNAQNQLGSPGAPGGANPPVSVSGLSGVSALSAGDIHTCAVLSGYVYCWGRAQEQQLGRDRELTSRASALVVPTPSGVATMASGLYHTCAASSGALWCWGNNLDGEVGGSCTDNDCPATQVSGLTGVSSLAAGADYSCALKAGVVSCWGILPWSSDGSSTTSPATVAALSGTQAIAAGVTSWWDLQSGATGAVRMCAVASNGTVKCFYGGSVTATAVTGISSAKSVAVGRNHACALLRGGAIQCWGTNAEGELGNGTNVDSPTTPVSVLAP